LGLACRVFRRAHGVTAKLTADGRGTAIEHSGNGPLGQALKLTKLDLDAFFNAEFMIRHSDTVPDGLGVALSFCRRPGIVQWTSIFDSWKS